VVRADNAGLFTLDGTRTHLVGRDRVAVLDPGPEDRRQLGRLLEAAGSASRVDILLTHGHADHAAGAPSLAGELRRRDVEVRLRGAAPEAEETLSDGERVQTDQGILRAVRTPGHAPEHLAFFWEETRILFAGDLVLGEGSTAWVGAYPGCVADYLASLDRIEALQPRRILPAHGPPLDDPPRDLARFREHRLRRVEQVRRLAVKRGEADVGRIVDEVYGPRLPDALRPAARWSVLALLDHLDVRPFPSPGPEGEG
jgi:glyoxylase-like metal-dependent hydrolase (beta-lactamase superfamily II)